MRYKELLAEAIPNRPMNLRAYLIHRVRDLDRMLTALTQAETLIQGSKSRDAEYLLRYGLRNGSEGTPEAEAADNVYGLVDARLDDYGYYLTDLKHDLESYLKYGPNWLEYILKLLDRVRPADDEIKSVFPLLPHAEIGFEKYGYNGDPQFENDEEYIAAKKLLAACRIKAAIITKTEAMQADIRSKLGTIADIRNHHSLTGKEYRPDHADIETLYHASVYVNEIIRDGFQAEKPVDRKGVGNFGNQDTISFTHDIGIARSIMRSFKEMWMIAHGQLTARQIMAWAKRENIEDDVRKAWNSAEGRHKPIMSDDPYETSKLYRYWLTFSKMRDNPVIISPWELIDVMKNRSIDDIGVVSCDVRLTKQDDYRLGESEFRVPASSIVSGTIKKVF